MGRVHLQYHRNLIHLIIFLSLKNKTILQWKQLK